MDIFSVLEVRFFFQILLALILGAIIGLEREYIGKEAGMRTFALISTGSALFTILSNEGFLGGEPDPSRIAAGIVVGIGFLASGVIIHRKEQIEGLTTAAALWSAGAIGMAVGVQFYSFAIIATIFTVFILALMKEMKIEEKKKL